MISASSPGALFSRGNGGRERGDSSSVRSTPTNASMKELKGISVHYPISDDGSPEWRALQNFEDDMESLTEEMSDWIPAPLAGQPSPAAPLPQAHGNSLCSKYSRPAPTQRALSPSRTQEILHSASVLATALAIEPLATTKLPTLPHMQATTQARTSDARALARAGIARVPPKAHTMEDIDGPWNGFRGAGVGDGGGGGSGDKASLSRLEVGSGEGGSGERGSGEGTIHSKVLEQTQGLVDASTQPASAQPSMFANTAGGFGASPAKIATRRSDIPLRRSVEADPSHSIIVADAATQPSSKVSDASPQPSIFANTAGGLGASPAKIAARRSDIPMRRSVETDPSIKVSVQPTAKAVPQVAQMTPIPHTTPEGAGIEALEEIPALITVKLGVDFQSTVGRLGSQLRTVFENDLKQDLARASGWGDRGFSGVSPENFKIKMVAPGSVIADVEIQADRSGIGPDAWSVAANIHSQQSDENSVLLSGVLTKHVISITQNQPPHQLHRQIARRPEISPILKTSPQYISKPRKSSIQYRAPSPPAGSSDSAPNIVMKDSHQEQLAAKDLMRVGAIPPVPFVKSRTTVGDEVEMDQTAWQVYASPQSDHEPSPLRSQRTIEMPRPDVPSNNPNAIRNQYLEVAPDFLTTMGDWTQGADSEGNSIASPIPQDRSTTLMGDFENSRTSEQSPFGNSHEGRPPSPQRGRQRHAKPQRARPFLHADSPQILQPSIVSQQDYSIEQGRRHSTSRTPSRSPSRSPPRDTNTLKPKISEGSMIISSEMVYYDENGGILSVPRGKDAKIIVSIDDPNRIDHSNPSTTVGMGQLRSCEPTANPNPVKPDWDVMGDFVPYDLDLSGMSDDILLQPPVRPLPDLPSGGNGGGAPPPKKPLPSINITQADLSSGANPEGKDGRRVLSDEEHRLMTFRINTEAAATMRGVNTLLAILAARNDAAEAKIRSQETIIAERGVYIHTHAGRAHTRETVVWAPSWEGGESEKV